MSSPILHSLPLTRPVAGAQRRAGLWQALGDWRAARKSRAAVARLDNRLRDDVGLAARRPDLACLPPLYPGF